MADLALWAGALVAAAAAAAALLERDPRRRALAMALALALAPILIAADNWDDARLRDLRQSPAVLLATVLGGAGLLAALALVFRRFPLAFPLLAFAALPFRIPVEAGGETANLLLPLYAVIAGGVVAALLGPFPDPGSGQPRPRAGRRGVAALAARWLPAALAGYVALYVVQGIYSDDLAKAVANVAFFFVPFAVLAALLLRTEWTPRLLVLVGGLVIAEAALFALVGFAQYGFRELLWNPQIIEANQLHVHFRVNSLFWDPNILGRYLALTIVAVSAAMLWTRSPRGALAAGSLTIALLAALAITFSQSSLVALLAGLAVLAALRWSARWTVALVLGPAAAAAIAIGLSGGFAVDLERRKSLKVQTSGRTELIRGGLELAEERPVAGYGSGSFEREFGRRFGSGSEAAAVASHTEPVTVAAEQGVIGLAAYVAVLSIALGALCAGIRRSAPGLRGGGRGLATGEALVVATARAALLAAVVAMVLHSLSYAAFFTDPITWALLATGLALARAE